MDEHGGNWSEISVTEMSKIIQSTEPIKRTRMEEKVSEPCDEKERKRIKNDFGDQFNFNATFQLSLTTKTFYYCAKYVTLCDA